MMSRPSIEYLKPTHSKPFIPLSEISILSMGVIEPFIENDNRNYVNQYSENNMKES